MKRKLSNFVKYLDGHMTVGLWNDQVLPLLHCSFTSEQVNFPVQLIYILRDLSEFLPFWWFLIILLQECHSFSKIFPRTIIFMDMTASYLFSNMLCQCKFLWHLASLCLQSCSMMVAFPSLPKPYLNFTAHCPCNFFNYLWIVPLHTMSKEQSSPLPLTFHWLFHIVKLLVE